MIRTQQANVARLWGNGAKMSKLGGKVARLGMWRKWLILEGLVEGGQDVQVILNFSGGFAVTANILWALTTGGVNRGLRR